jgi:biopolymer transport protein ExbD
MGIDLSGGMRGIVADVNVVPLIDILLVLLVIFMIILPADGAPGELAPGGKSAGGG